MEKFENLNELIIALLLWITSNTDYINPKQLPEVKFLEQNELYDLDSWNDTTIRYKNVEDAVDFDDTALNAMSPPPLSSPSTNGQNDVDTNNDEEEDPISDLDDDDEDFSMEAVKKWTNIMFKKDEKQITSF